MRRWSCVMGLAMCSVLGACTADSTSPDFRLDLAEIGTTSAAQWLVVPDSVRAGEPFVITIMATNRGCESPGGLSITEEPRRLRIVGVARKEMGRETFCPSYGGFSQRATVTPSVEGTLTVSLVGRVGNRTDSLSRVVVVLPSRKAAGARAMAATPIRGTLGD